MLILLSPAKSMEMSIDKQNLPATAPLFVNEANEIASIMKAVSVDELAKILKVNPELAKLNNERFSQFNSSDCLQKQALLAYNGSVFKHIHRDTFSVDDYLYAQNHLRIISTLYGLTRPLDLIKAYRLAYKLKFPQLTEGNLYDYWRPRLTLPLIADIQSTGGVLVNLASRDVLPSLDMEQMKQAVTVITPEFQECRSGKYETVRTYAKMARGEMTHYILRNRLTDIASLKQFTWNSFAYCEELSTDTHYIYTSTL